MAIKLCRNCRSPFTARGKKRFCSALCQKKSWQDSRPPCIKNCVVCNAQFVAVRNMNTCSENCRHLRRLERARVTAGQRRKSNRNHIRQYNNSWANKNRTHVRERHKFNYYKNHEQRKTYARDRYRERVIALRALLLMGAPID